MIGEELTQDENVALLLLRQQALIELLQEKGLITAQELLHRMFQVEQSLFEPAEPAALIVPGGIQQQLPASLVPIAAALDQNDREGRL